MDSEGPDGVVYISGHSLCICSTISHSHNAPQKERFDCGTR